MPKAHRNQDPRICGALTVVQGQSSVFVNNLLWAVIGDPNTDVLGNLNGSPDGSVKVEGKEVVVHRPENAQEDLLCPIVGEPHCNPQTASGSDNVFAYGQ